MLKNKNKVDIVYIVIANIIRIIFAYEAIKNLIAENYTQMVIAFLGIIGTFVPYIINNIFKVKLLKVLNFAILIFVFGAQYFGSLKNIYDVITFYDTILHTASGIILFLIGVNVIKIVDERTVNKLFCYPMVIVSFAFCFAISWGVFWEFYEFASDRILGTDMQLLKSGGDIALMDTMIDLLSGAAGAIVASICTYFYLKKNKKETINE